MSSGAPSDVPQAEAGSPLTTTPRVHVARERGPGERRVAATPETVRRFVAAGLAVSVERDAGAGARVADHEYAEAGATIVDAVGPDAPALVLRVAPPTVDEARAMPAGSVLVSFVAPHRNLDVVRALADADVSTLAMELVPRTSRAQAMDALSSQANLAGYRAVLLAAHELDKYFPLFMTAAGTIRPATVVVLGAGVAGLQAVATARRLGAVVEVSDVRAAAREEVASLGGRFIDLPEAEDQSGSGGYAKEAAEDFLARQRAVLTRHLASAHAVITTASVPGRRAPVLVTREMVEAMPSGSVVIDLAAADGGNCELTDVARTVEHGGVRVIPGHDLPNAMPSEASALYARNVAALVALLTVDGEVGVRTEDDVVAAALLTHAGRVAHAPTAALLEGSAR